MNAPTVMARQRPGRRGRGTVLTLLRRGLPIRALFHRDDAPAAALRDRGAEVVVGDLRDADGGIVAGPGRLVAFAALSRHPLVPLPSIADVALVGELGGTADMSQEVV